MEVKRMRTFLAFFHMMNFLIMIFATIYILYSFGGQLEAWRLPLYTYYLIMGLSGAAIAYWIAIDGKRLENYAANLEQLQQKLLKLEQTIKIIKPRTQEKK
jgi:predicted membrane protein